MDTAPNLILIGPMGAGKSAIGRRLAERLGLEFVDADRWLEELTGADIPLIFECEGEAGFRARERALLADLCAGSGKVIATGGGAVLDPDNRRLLRERGLVIHLHASVGQQLRRLQHDRSRPLLQAPDRRQRLLDLAAHRDRLYAECADLRLDTDGLTVAQACEHLLPVIERGWQRPETA